MYQNILVPVDGSDTAAKALREAIQLASSLSSRIRVMGSVPRLHGLGRGVLRVPPHDKYLLKLYPSRLTIVAVSCRYMQSRGARHVHQRSKAQQFQPRESANDIGLAEFATSDSGVEVGFRRETGFSAAALHSARER